MSDIQRRYKIRRGTDAEIQAAEIEAYEPVFATDTKVLYISNGPNEAKTGLAGVSDHAALTNIGTNTHAQIDSFISSKAAANGVASLNASSLVVQNPANATATAGASKIPISDGQGKLDSWVSLSSKADTSHTHSESDISDLQDYLLGNNVLLEQITTPGSVAEGFTQIYAKSDGKVYKKSYGGVEEEIGTGGGGTAENNIDGTAGENLAAYDVVYASAGSYYKAQSDNTEAEADAVGIVTEALGITSAATGEITLGGLVTNAGWSWTAGAQLYLSGTYGGISETEPTTVGDYVKPLGFAVSATQIFFNPQAGWVVGGIQDHASAHITGGSDEIDGDKLDIDWNPSNYTPATVESYADSVDNLTAHLKGIDTAIGSVSVSDEVVQDVVGGRLDLVSATSIKWSFQNSNHIRLFNPTSEQWELVQVTTEPTIANTALVPNTIYDVFAEYNSATAFDLVLSRWATGGDGANNSSTSYATPVMTANNAPGPVTVSATSILAGQYEYTAFNQADGTQDSTGSWISNATPSSGSPQSLMVDFGQPVCINKYILKERYASTQNYRAFPKTWTLEGSNSGAIGDAAGDVNGTSGWYLLDTVASSTEPGNNAWEAAYHTFINNKSFQKYRLRITDRYGSDSYVAINELKLVAASNSLAGGSSRVRAYESTVTYNIGDRVTYGGKVWVKASSAAANTTPVAGNDWVDNGAPTGGDGANNASTAYATPIMTSNSAPSGTITYTSQYDSNLNAARNAFNQNSSDTNRWTSSAAPTAQSPQTLMYDYGNGTSRIVNKYQILSYNHSDFDIRAYPKAWTFEGTSGVGVNSDASGSNGWVVLDSRSTISDPGQSNWGTYTFYNTTSYQKYRIVITDRNGVSAYVSMDNFKLIEARDDFTGLYRHNGVLVSDSSTTGKSRRWLGIIYTYNNSGTVNFKDDVNYRYISNWYNRRLSSLKTNNTTANWTYNVSAVREMNNGTGQVRGQLISSGTTNLKLNGIASLYYASTPAWYRLSFGVNTTSSMSNISEAYVGTPNVNISVPFSDISIVSSGFNYITLLEQSVSGQAVTVVGNTVLFGSVNIEY